MKNADQLGAIKELALALLGEVESLAAGEEPAAKPNDGEADGDFYEMIEAYEISLIRRALLRSRGNQAMAARMLRLKPSTLNHKIKLYRIRPDPKTLLPGPAAADVKCLRPCAPPRASQQSTVSPHAPPRIDLRHRLDDMPRRKCARGGGR